MLKDEDALPNADARVDGICRAIAPVLNGQDPMDIGVVLMWLTARWLSGHHVPGDPAGTLELQKRLFDMQAKTMWRMVELDREEFERRAADGEGVEL